MRFLVLAYGDEKDWNALSREEQAALLAQDEVLRGRGDVVEALQRGVTVQSWDRGAPVKQAPFARAPAPLAGFGVIEAHDLDEAVALVSRTPCAVAKGAVEVWPIRTLGS